MPAHRIVDNRDKGPPATDEKRRCIVLDCDTVLSRYNPAETCRIHTKPLLNTKGRRFR